MSDIIIIGGGIGGLSAAIHLAAAGKRVKILEQNPQVGGKMGEVHEAGFRWDTGPSVLTMRHVFDDLFEVAGKRLEEYIHLTPIDPLTRYFYPDGFTLDVTQELDEMSKQIAMLDERDVEGYLAYLSYAARLHRITGPVFIYNEPPSIRRFLQVSPMDAFKVDGLRSMQKAIEGFVKSPHMRQLLGRFATYVGASPYEAPATLNVIAHVELNGGVWYPNGGMFSVAKGMAKLADELDVEIQTRAPVQQIRVEDGKVIGVATADGEFHAAEAVIANVDVATVYEKLLPPEVVSPRRLDRLLNIEPSSSGFIMLLGINEMHPQLEHHNIFFSSDYKREFDDIFGRGIPPEEPTIYVSISAKTDFDDSPQDHENWFVLVNVPALGTGWDWHAEQNNYRNLILDRLAQVFHIDVRQRIVAEQIFTPHSLERMTGARRGALYGTSSNHRWAAFRRPHNRAEDVKGLYFAGGTTHPGGGVPMVTLSGKVAANLVLEDLA